jgi:methyl-accepting chemotaxis protein
MSIKPNTSIVVLTALALSLGTACVQENVEQKKRELKHIQKDLSRATEDLKSGVREQSERAKASIAKLGEQLPEVKQNAREGLEKAGEGLRETRDKVVDTVKGTLQVASDKVDQTVDKARHAGD